MSRLSDKWDELKAQGRKALIPYIVAGDPNPEFTVEALHELVAKGSDILELGVPFSDPMAEGPTIALGHERALEHNVGLKDVLAMVASFRQQDNTTPVVLMGYANPVEVMGHAEFAKAASQAGVDGLLTVDLPPEEAGSLDSELKQVGIDNIFLLAPTTTDARAQKICDAASGYLYYVSVKGVTGAGNLDVEEVSSRVSSLRSMTDLPISVGFGIKDADTAAAIASVSDGAVVGSALVQRIYQQSTKMNNSELAQYGAELIADMRTAIDNNK
ncbi:Tryptophan synthase alpha chain [Sinobacterium norvegicum]|uniref:Tryptophan synthase alpha chain n=1 Tax=Sinobacterium norvegicum TaxID=1641715 RepID=A0ABM9AAZ1_9GAMM|nr:tryptophan synthase subunit alpha [Sinobacterium norvegicum]CAH0990363.1 Tryptophan synthase alpha chain [Sinobacterium norvegicum]